MKFRKDINGLRAIAVIAVVLFHFNASWMPGGFAGVDVFFVISGFLMTGIIFTGIEQSKFSIVKFYFARANRIIPALALLCLVLLIFGWFYLTPLEYQALGKHAASSVSFVSNFVYWKEAGYFDAASHEKWLLHSWSLSVEWQFYIIYPLILVAMRKFMSLKIMKVMLLIGTGLGFIFCVFASYRWPSASYFLLPTRAWEMMLGGVAYLYPFTLQENRKKLLEWTGLALVIGSYFFISADNPWPGYLALFPVLGSFFILQAEYNDSIVTSNIVLQNLGSWSYSIYLWHWPFVVAIYVFSLPESYIYLGMIFSVILGFLSYKYVEKLRFRNDFSSLLSYFGSKPIYIAGSVGLLGSTLAIGYPSFIPYRLQANEIAIVEQEQTNPRQPECDKFENSAFPECIYGAGPVKAIVVGDSHANAQMVAIGNRAALQDSSILSLALSACPTIEDVYKVDAISKKPIDRCTKVASAAIDVAAQKYPNVPVIIINRTSLYLDGKNEDDSSELTPPTYFVDDVFTERNDEYKDNLTEHMVDTICEFSQNNPVYLVRPTPEMKEDVPLTMFRDSTLDLDDSQEHVRITIDEYKQRQAREFEMQDMAAKRCGAKVLDPLPYLCDSKYCYGDIDGIPIYYDDDHLSSYGSKVISPIYDELFEH